MPLSGTFDTVALSELLQWFHTTAKTGTLTISVDMEDTYLVLEEGDVAAVGSDDPLRLDPGQVLLARKRITEEQLQDALRASGPGRSVAGALVRTGAIGKAEMSTLQAEHLFEMVMDLFFQEQGSFHFSPGDSVPGLLAPPDIPEASFLVQPISTHAILMESMKRVDEWNRIRQVFPNRFVVVHALQGDSDTDTKATDPVWQALMEVGQPISVGELCLRMGVTRFGAYRQLFESYNLGLVGLDLMPTGRAGQEHLGPAQMLVENARLLLAEQQFDEAREVLATVANLEPENPEIRKMIRQVRGAQLEHLYQLIPPHRTLALTFPFQDLAASGLSQREKYLAARLSGKLDVATLVVATPLGELETLRILRKLLHAGIAAFAD